MTSFTLGLPQLRSRCSQGPGVCCVLACGRNLGPVQVMGRLAAKWPTQAPLGSPVYCHQRRASSRLPKGSRITSFCLTKGELPLHQCKAPPPFPSFLFEIVLGKILISPSQTVCLTPGPVTEIDESEKGQFPFGFCDSWGRERSSPKEGGPFSQ